MRGNTRWYRSSVVAGQFYPGSAAALRGLLQEYMHERFDESAIAIMVPHAGYLFSGRTAGRVFSRISIPDRVIVLCPNHTQQGEPLAVWPEGAWAIPGAEIPIDEELAELIISTDQRFKADSVAHLHEHGIEVQLPFLHVRNPNVKVVPIAVSHHQCEELIDLGMMVAELILSSNQPVLVVASSDMSHYLSAGEASRLDNLALDKIESLDPRGLYRICRKHRISMCGLVPTTLALSIAVHLAATGAQVVEYTHSGMVTGDLDSVVAYAGVIVD